MGAMVGRARRDVDRDVADQPDAALGRVRAQRAPLAVEADLVGDRAAPGARAQSSIHAASRSRKSSSSACTTGAVGSASSAGQAANAERALYGEPQRSGGHSGSICHYD